MFVDHPRHGQPKLTKKYEAKRTPASRIDQAGQRCCGRIYLAWSKFEQLCTKDAIVATATQKVFDT
jgi:hypothetical protein